MTNNLIQWPCAKYWDKAWNPIIGCRPVSPACDNCYARAMSGRFHKSFAPTPTTKTNPPRKGVVFCGNMTDLFGEWNDSPVDAVAKTAKKSNAEATYIYLTKRVERMAAMLGGIVIGEPFTDKDIFQNHYFGFTAENQEWYDKRRDAIYHNWPYWANLWISAEPLLGPIDDMKLGNIVAGNRCRWLVVGCESGPHRRPCKLEWVESIVEQCMAENVPVFVKQLDINGCCVTDINKFPAHLRIRQVPWATKGGAA
jgi:protein gp37